MKKKRLLTSMLAFAMVLSLFSFNNGMSVYAAEPAFTGYDFVKYGSFKEGDPITIRLDFDTPVTVTGTPTIPVTVGTDTDNAVYTGNIDSDSLEFVYAADNQANWSGPFVTGPVSLNGGTIKGLDGQDANLSGFTGGSDMGIVIDNVDPIIQNIERSNPTPAAINSFAEDNIQFKVYFNEPVTGAGINDFTITATSTAAVTISSITGNGTDTITVNGTTLDGEGSLRIDYLTSVGNITDLAGNPVASNFTTGESYDVVNVVTFPVVIRVEVPAETYGPSDVLLFCIHFSEPVVVTGTPSLNITIGGVSRSAEYFDGSGEKNLFFRYDLQESDPTDLDGIGMSTELSLNGGTVKSVADSDDSDTILYFIDDLTHMRVDMIAPTISSAAIVGTNDYVLVTLSEPVYNKLDTIFTNYPVYVDAKCFELKFSQNGGNATGASISSVVSETGDPLTGGEAVLRFNLNINGVPSGVETIEIKPSSAGYVYDLVDNPMSTAQRHQK
jgi:hypothetical protein